VGAGPAPGLAGRALEDSPGTVRGREGIQTAMQRRGFVQMKLNCLCCGHKIDLDDAYDDYAGQVKCFACSGVLEIRTEEGMVKSVALAGSLCCEPLPVCSPGRDL
jgi:hypothetical protein